MNESMACLCSISATVFVGSFREEWVEQLRALPYEQYGDFLKDTIYPALTEEERKLWHKSQISNRALHAALQAGT